jgi:DNA-directed RNA polymerase I, II, and III subunit RPABC2
MNPEEEDKDESTVNTGSESEENIDKKKGDDDSELESIADSDSSLASEHDGEDDEEEEDEEDEEEEEDDDVKTSSNKPNMPSIVGFGGDDDDDDDADEEEEDENYLQKFDESLKKNIIADWHPEDQVHNDEEVETMCTIVRDANGFIVDPLHKTLPFVTKYEKARILGERAKQLDAGGKPFIALKDNMIDSYLIALKEYEAKKIPFVVRRPLPSGACEYWRLRDLEFLE